MNYAIGHTVRAGLFLPIEKIVLFSTSLLKSPQAVLRVGINFINIYP